MEQSSSELANADRTGSAVQDLIAHTRAQHSLNSAEPARPHHDQSHPLLLRDARDDVSRLAALRANPAGRLREKIMKECVMIEGEIIRFRISAKYRYST